MKFEDCFLYDKKRYAVVILFFDTMIRRDFTGILKSMKECRSRMLCDSIGYNLPDAEDCDWIDGDYIELWWVAGTHEHSCNISYAMFVECLKISANIWINHNDISNNSEMIKEITDSIHAIEMRYIYHS